VIAVAGLGSRLGMGKPKCLIEIEGVSILEHQLSLLKDVEDVRVVVGFEEIDVMEKVHRLSPDAIVVRNPGYRTTTTLHSYAMGAAGLKEYCLFLDGDILFSPKSFSSFLDSCFEGNPIIGITQAKTLDAVFVKLDKEKRVTGFSRTDATDYEWANIAWLHPDVCYLPNGAVFERLDQYLPVYSREIVSFEIDTSEDLQMAMDNLPLIGWRVTTV
jgi:choline kinase